MKDRNEKLEQINRSKTLKIVLAAVIIAAVGAALFFFGKSSPAFIDGVYKPFSRFLMRVLSYINSLLPFSVAELLLYIGIAVLMAALLRLLWVLITGPRRLAYLCRFLSWVLLVASLAGTLFYVNWGMNYYNKTLASQLGYSVHQRHYSELVELNRWIVAQANANAELVVRDADGVMPAPDFVKLAKSVAAEFSKTSGQTEAPAKYVLASKYLSYTRITGIFMPYTGEANVNKNNIPADLAFCMAHETAHRYAVAREDEANFFAFYVLWDSDDPELRYSAFLAAIRYCQNQLYSENYDEFAAVYEEYSPLVVQDLRSYTAHWKQYEGKAAEVSEKVNDTYLVVQGQSDGVKSYGRMVDLMLAWYEAEIKG